MKHPPLFLDIMLNGRFVCQMKYVGNPRPIFIDGKVVPTYKIEDIARFVFRKRPSLRGKNINIKFTNQKIVRQL